MAEPGTSAVNGSVHNATAEPTEQTAPTPNVKVASPVERQQRTSKSKKQRMGVPLRGITDSTESGSSSRFISGGSSRSNQSQRWLPQCTNVTLFAVAYALLVLFCATIDQYFVGMLSHVQMRFHYPKHELDFITGVEKIGFAISLLFVGYYGNKLHKPVAMAVGSVVFAVGSITCAVPYFIDGEREEWANSEGVPTYVLAALCRSTRLVEELADENITLSEQQCDEYPFSGHQKRASYSLLCVGQLFMGIGSSFLATLGLVYIDENARKKDTPLLLGIVLSMRGLGDMLGVLLASKFAEIDEGLEDSVAILNWHVGAWWLGMPILAGCLLICAIFLPFFPQWIHEPRWLVQRRIRLQQLAERRQRRLEEVQAKRRRRKRRERQKIREREQRQAQGPPPHYSNGADPDGGKNKNSDNNNPGKAKSQREESSKNSEQNGKVASKKTGEKSESSNSTDAEKIEARGKQQSPRKKVSISETGDTPDDVVLSRQSEAGVRRSKSQSKRNKSDKNDSGDNSETTETEAEAEKRRKEEEEEEKRKKKRRLGRRLQDLPKNLWYLLSKVSFTSAVIGATLSSYIRSGFQPALPHFLHVQYHYEEHDALQVSGLTLGIASAIGVFAGGFLIYRKHGSVYAQLKLVLVLATIAACLSALLFIPTCDDLKMKTILDYNDPVLLATGYCGKVCDCKATQYMPVCSEDGELYPTPCHAGCQEAILEPDNKYLNFTDCGCHAEVSAKWCKTECVEMIPYVAISFAMVLVQSMAYVPVVFFFLRIITEKLRSLSLGFAFWLVFIFGYCPGYAAYYVLDESSCNYYERDCHDRKLCWLYDTAKYGYLHNGVTVGLLVAAVGCFIVTWYEVRKLVRLGSRVGLPYDSPIDDIIDGDQAASRSKSKKSSLEAGGGSASGDNPVVGAPPSSLERNGPKTRDPVASSGTDNMAGSSNDVELGAVVYDIPNNSQDGAEVGDQDNKNEKQGGALNMAYQPEDTHM